MMPTVERSAGHPAPYDALRAPHLEAHAARLHLHAAAALLLAYAAGAAGYHWSALVPLLWLLVAAARSQLDQAWSTLRTAADDAASAKQLGRESVEWVNQSICAVWPLHAPGFANYTKETALEPLLRDYGKVRLGGVQMGSVKVKRFHLGTLGSLPHGRSRLAPLYLKHMELVSRSEHRAADRVRLVLRTDVRYAARDASLLLELTLTGGLFSFLADVRGLEMSGVLLIELDFVKPYPWLGTVSLSFLERPAFKFNLVLENQADLTEILPQLKSWMRGLVEEAIGNRLLAPQKYSIPLFEWYGDPAQMPKPIPRAPSALPTPKRHSTSMLKRTGSLRRRSSRISVSGSSPGSIRGEAAAQQLGSDALPKFSRKLSDEHADDGGSDASTPRQGSPLVEGLAGPLPLALVGRSLDATPEESAASVSGSSGAVAFRAKVPRERPAASTASAAAATAPATKPRADNRAQSMQRPRPLPVQTMSMDEFLERDHAPALLRNALPSAERVDVDLSPLGLSPECGAQSPIIPRRAQSAAAAPELFSLAGATADGDSLRAQQPDAVPITVQKSVSGSYGGSIVSSLSASSFPSLPSWQSFMPAAWATRLSPPSVASDDRDGSGGSLDDASVRVAPVGSLALARGSPAERRKAEAVDAQRAAGAIGVLYVTLIDGVGLVAPRDTRLPLAPTLSVTVSLGAEVEERGTPVSAATATVSNDEVRIHFRQLYRLHVHDTTTQCMRLGLMIKDGVKPPTEVASGRVALSGLSFGEQTRQNVILQAREAGAAGRAELNVQLRLELSEGDSAAASSPPGLN